MRNQLLGRLELNRVYQWDCIEGMKQIPDKSIDMILCDLPYGTTACKWDTVIPFEPLWEQYNRIIKDSGAIVLTAAQPFTSALVMSSPDLFRHEWIWNKKNPTGHLSAKYAPMRLHESVLVFSKNRVTYNPQMEVLAEDDYRIRKNGKRRTHKEDTVYGTVNGGIKQENNLRYPKTIIEFPNGNSRKDKKVHPTQKPVALFEYLIRTYSNEEDIVLDNCMGSGTTAVACVRTNRNFIGFETELTYVEIANKRLKNELETR
ncbi:site-specific DNA-methyltransferase [Neobacillus niacini]|uniref:DNA-methyltransferase n=1 Tax=Neobacillus niacini TaxID=86668 RepID=UPI00285DDB06|nr:site-specific DNA-methyltransferase [Neobacillus niacini]MDR7001627.1 site-specific DNA-methyltransferase (adenine-specific) [Neobacillus niacini]